MPHLRCDGLAFVENIRDLDGRMRGTSFPDGTLAEPDRLRLKRLEMLRHHAVRGHDVEGLCGLAKFIDDPAMARGELGRANEDSREDRLEIESGTDRLTDLAERLKLRYRSGELRCARPKFLEEPDVFDRNYGLVGEGLEQCNLFCGEEACLGARQGKRSDGLAFTQERNPGDAAKPHRPGDD